MASQQSNSEIIRGIVTAMYTAGNDKRREKNGSPGTLIEALNDSSTTCIGLFEQLPSNFQYIIDNKEMCEEAMKNGTLIPVFKFIRRRMGQYVAGKWLVAGTEKAISALDSYISTGQMTKEQSKYLKIRSWFLDQERKKVIGSRTLIYDEKNMAAQLKMLNDII
jgi:hypothetical protein